MTLYRTFRVGLLSLAALLAALFGTYAAAEERPVAVFVDTRFIDFDVQPLIVDGTTLVQFRPLFETMGMEVKWDEASRTVTGSKNGLTVVLRIDDPAAEVNGERQQLEQSPRIVDGNTMVPLRFVGESTGAIVYWDGVNREITILTEKLLQQRGLTKEELLKWIAEYEAKQQAATESPQPPAPSDPQPTPPPASAEPADLNALLGMYYGFRDDIGGYECGGACWDLYTFLPNQRIWVGLPPEGGPETIDCERGGCLTYTIAEGKLKLSSGETYTIGSSEEGSLAINDVALYPVQPAADGLKLQGTYEYIGYSGLIGVNAASSSWTETLTFSEDGTFESADLTLASLDAKSSAANSSAAKSDKGTYRISGNTIELAYSDGTVVRSLFFDHEPGGTNELQSIQIGSNRFYISEENE